MKTFLGSLCAKSYHFGVVVSRFNEFITRRLLQSAVETLRQAGVPEKRIQIVWVPGALEIPFYCKKLATRKKIHGLIALACVIRGDTYHFECVAHEVTRGISQVALETQVPVATGILTVDNLEQAIDRAGLKSGNKGAQAALTALEIVNLNRLLGKNNRMKAS